MASAPALTSGFIGLPPFSSSAITELNGRPVLFTPTVSSTASGPSASQTSANTNALETDWMENSCRASPTLWEAPVTETMLRPNSAGSASASAGM